MLASDIFPPYSGTKAHRERGHYADTEFMAEKITERLVKGIEVPEKGYRIVYDTEIKGFGARTTKAGDRSFVFNFGSKGAVTQNTGV